MRKLREQEPEGFIRFWSVWQPASRNTDGRGLAREAYRKHILNGADPQDIIDGASYFTRSLTAKDKDYVPLSATWLNRETYADLAPKERAFQARLAEKRTTPPPKPISQPVEASHSSEDRAAIVRRVYERQGLPTPENLH